MSWDAQGRQAALADFGVRLAMDATPKPPPTWTQDAGRRVTIPSMVERDVAPRPLKEKGALLLDHARDFCSASKGGSSAKPDCAFDAGKKETPASSDVNRYVRKIRGDK